MRAAATLRRTLLCTMALPALGLGGWAQPDSQPEVLDSVVAVVNNHAILSSDVDNDMRLSVLVPEAAANLKPNRRSALQQLIRQELIEEQMTPEEKRQTEPTEEKVQARLELLRKELPACARYHCVTDQGWAAFLAANRLTPGEAETYLRRRLSLLSYIENRFRQGIRISQEDIDNYYRDTLLPQYPAGQTAPTLESVAPRIREILLQQQVTQLFSSWLDNLRKQGDVEILDPALVAPGESTPAGSDQ